MGKKQEKKVSKLRICTPPALTWLRLCERCQRTGGQTVPGLICELCPPRLLSCRLRQPVFLSHWGGAGPLLPPDCLRENNGQRLEADSGRPQGGSRPDGDCTVLRYLFIYSPCGWSQDEPVPPLLGALCALEPPVSLVPPLREPCPEMYG